MQRSHEMLIIVSKAAFTALHSDQHVHRRARLPSIWDPITSVCPNINKKLIGHSAAVLIMGKCDERGQKKTKGITIKSTSYFTVFATQYRIIKTKVESLFIYYVPHFAEACSLKSIAGFWPWKLRRNARNAPPYQDDKSRVSDIKTLNRLQLKCWRSQSQKDG